LHAAVGRITSWCRPTEDHFVALLRTGEQIGSLLHTLDRGQRRAALTAARQTRDNEQN